MDTPLVRMIDACINRATEGLRVVEDFARFLLDDPHLTSLTKDLRHELTSALASIPVAERLAARETQRDVGAAIAGPGEYARENAAQVCSASFKRTQEALRSLEEYSKLIDARLARRLEALRYRAYTLERTFGIRTHVPERLAAARLYVLVDGRESEAAFETLVSSLVEAGVHAIQLREKSLADGPLVGRARLLVEACRGSNTLAIVNDRPDVAVLSGADGVHLGQDDLPVKDARTIVGTQMQIGVSTHSLDEARAAVVDGASYLGVGPVFPSTTKQFVGPVCQTGPRGAEAAPSTGNFQQLPGLGLVRAVAEEISLPWFAIGGINGDNISQVLAEGASRVAISSAVVQAQNPKSAAAALLDLYL
jgi:thiamine-phosphate pyrophosphorylase